MSFLLLFVFSSLHPFSGRGLGRDCASCFGVLFYRLLSYLCFSSYVFFWASLEGDSFMSMTVFVLFCILAVLCVQTFVRGE